MAKVETTYIDLVNRISAEVEENGFIGLFALIDAFDRVLKVPEIACIIKINDQNLWEFEGYKDLLQKYQQELAERKQVKEQREQAANDYIKRLREKYFKKD